VNNTLNLFQSFRTILCVCPHCRDVLRLSDLHLAYKGAAPRTWLDTYDTKIRTIERKEELFEEKEGKLRDAAAERAQSFFTKTNDLTNQAESSCESTNQGKDRRRGLMCFNQLTVTPFRYQPLHFSLGFG